MHLTSETEYLQDYLDILDGGNNQEASIYERQMTSMKVVPWIRKYI